MVEMAEIFHRHGPAYRVRYGGRMLPSHRKAMRDIERCRTPELGGHVYSCATCEETIYQYHSCRDRHCPKCQNGKAQQWLQKQQEHLPAARYFMLTFTLPAELRREEWHAAIRNSSITCSSAPRPMRSRSWAATRGSWAGEWGWSAYSTLGGAT